MKRNNLKFLGIIVLIVIIFCFYIFSERNTSAYIYFTKYEQNCDFINNQQKKYYKLIRVENNNELLHCSYLLELNNYKIIDGETKLKMIENLLRYEGDSTSCSLRIKCYEPKISQLFYSSDSTYSIQMEALFIINQLFFDQPFIYSPYPILKDVSSGNLSTTNNEIIHNAYKEYRQWFDKIKEIGISNAQKQKLEPLNSLIRWYK